VRQAGPPGKHSQSGAANSRGVVDPTAHVAKGSRTTTCVLSMKTGEPMSFDPGRFIEDCRARLSAADPIEAVQQLMAATLANPSEVVAALDHVLPEAQLNADYAFLFRS